MMYKIDSLYSYDRMDPFYHYHIEHIPFEIRYDSYPDNEWISKLPVFCGLPRSSISQKITDVQWLG